MMTLSILLKVTVTMLLAIGAVRASKHSPAAVRHVVLAAAFAVVLLLPIASIIAPTIRVPVPAVVQDALIPVDINPVSDSTAAAPKAVAPSRLPEPAPWSRPSVSTVLAGVWAAGAIVFLLPIAVGLWQVRALRRTALPWRHGRFLVSLLAAETRVRRDVAVLLHESVEGPMTCGVVRPAILLPMDADTWTNEDLRRAVVHELEHVRRLDWISQCLARVAAACYWFHPMVWVAWRQMSLEAERACDDAVLRRSEATAYADQLVVLARRLSVASSQPLLAMANRSDLATRVGAVLDRGQRRGRAGAWCVGAAIAVTAILAAGMSSIRIVAASQTPQTTAASSPGNSKTRYDAASIKPCEPEENPTGARGTAGGTNATFSPGRFYVPCVTTEQLIYLAYASYGAPEGDRLVNDQPGSASNAEKIRGGPAWVHSLRDKYRVEAVAEGATERTVLMGTMLRTLLAERFKLKIHRDEEIVDMFAMTVAKSGFKLRQMQEGDCEPIDGPPLGVPPPANGKPFCNSLSMRGNGPNMVWTWGGFPASSVAGRLSGALGRHVIDRTGITGAYIMRLEFHPDENTPGIKWPPERDADTSVPIAASIYTALEQQLGLKIEKTRAPRGFIVIDAIERPTPDGPSAFAMAPARARGAGGR
jgi:uncharacterized protein (TIGR03435 family)